MNYNIIYHNNIAYQIVDEVYVHNFQNSDGSVNQKVLGMYVHQLGADRVVMKERKLLICKTIEEAVIVE
mgnify:CR=1 FL=1